MAALLKIISAFLCLQLFQVWAHECDRRLMGSSGVVSSYNFPLDNKNQTCTYEHHFEGFDGKVKEICFQFKRFDLSGNSFLYIDEEYKGRGSLSMSNLCVPVMDNVFRMVNFVAEPSPGFFATYFVVTEDTNVMTFSQIDSTTNPPTRNENVFCNSSDLFQCFDGKQCINSSLQCNLEFDCDDHSDEAYATARCEGASGQNSSFRAVHVSSVPAEFSDYWLYTLTASNPWKVENRSEDSQYGPKHPHLSGYYFRMDFEYGWQVLNYGLEEDLYKDNISYCLSFWYHSNGKDAGALWVYWGPYPQWPIFERLGDYKSIWLKAEVQRVPTALDENYIRFYPRSGAEDRIQPAVQDISVMPGPCHSNADYELADDISCTFEDGMRCRIDESCTSRIGMCRWTDETDWNIEGFNGTHLSTPIAAQGLFYLTPADNSSLVLKSPFLTRRRPEACYY